MNLDDLAKKMGINPDEIKEVTDPTAKAWKEYIDCPDYLCAKKLELLNKALRLKFDKTKK